MLEAKSQIIALTPDPLMPAIMFAKNKLSVMGKIYAGAPKLKMRIAGTGKKKTPCIIIEIKNQAVSCFACPFKKAVHLLMIFFV